MFSKIGYHSPIVDLEYLWNPFLRRAKVTEDPGDASADVFR